MKLKSTKFSLDLHKISKVYLEKELIIGTQEGLISSFNLNSFSLINSFKTTSQVTGLYKNEEYIYSVHLDGSVKKLNNFQVSIDKIVSRNAFSGLIQQDNTLITIGWDGIMRLFNLNFDLLNPIINPTPTDGFIAPLIVSAVSKENLFVGTENGVLLHYKLDGTRIKEVPVSDCMITDLVIFHQNIILADESDSIKEYDITNEKGKLDFQIS